MGQLFQNVTRILQASWSLIFFNNKITAQSKVAHSKLSRLHPMQDLASADFFFSTHFEANPKIVFSPYGSWV